MTLRDRLCSRERQFTFNGRPSLHNWCSSLMGFFLGVSLEALRMYGIDVADYADPTVPNAVAANNVNASSSQTGAQHNPPSVPAGQGGGGQQRAQLSSREAPSLLSTQTFSPVPRVITGLVSFAMAGQTNHRTQSHTLLSLVQILMGKYSTHWAQHNTAVVAPSFQP